MRRSRPLPPAARAARRAIATAPPARRAGGEGRRLQHQYRLRPSQRSPLPRPLSHCAGEGSLLPASVSPCGFQPLHHTHHFTVPFCHDNTRSRATNSSVITPENSSAITISAAAWARRWRRRRACRKPSARSPRCCGPTRSCSTMPPRAPTPMRRPPPARQRPAHVHRDRQCDPRGGTGAAAGPQPRPGPQPSARAALSRRAVQPHPYAAERFDPGRRRQAPPGLAGRGLQGGHAGCAPLA